MYVFVFVFGWFSSHKRKTIYIYVFCSSFRVLSRTHNDRDGERESWEGRREAVLERPPDCLARFSGGGLSLKEAQMEKRTDIYKDMRKQTRTHSNGNGTEGKGE